MDKKEKLEQIYKKLQELDVPELEQVEHVINSLELTRAGKLHYLGHFLGIECDFEKEEVKMHLGMYNANTIGVAQGGALYTLADIAIGYQILNKVADKKKVVTLELKINYVKPGEGKELIAKPQVLHWGRRTVVAGCAIEDEQGDLVAQALGTFYLLEKDRKKIKEFSL